MTTSLKTPVAFIIFNRPKCTRRVFAEIRSARPEKLYLIADAPRADRPGEAEKCAETRALVEEMIDWPCEVHKNYAEENMGCGQRIPSGLNWVFEQEECAIIMEDDIVADTSFFSFCDEMLKRYKHDERIVQVAGYNQLHYSPTTNTDFFFSSFSPIWGWGTWRRVWKFYSKNIANSEELLNAVRKNSLSLEEAALFISRLKRVEEGGLDTWDYHWRALCLFHAGLSIIPSRNLIKNIGFGKGATHTISPFSKEKLRKVYSMTAPYKFPESVCRDMDFDNRISALRQRGIKTEQLKDRLLKLYFQDRH